MDVKEVFAQRLVTLRKNAGLTQLQLAEKLNYSDKAVSKWERAEAVPDVTALISIADLFGVSLDSLVKEEVVPMPKKTVKKNRAVITLLVLTAIVAVECATFVVLQGALPSARNPIYCFVYPLPAFAVVLTILSSLWFNKTYKMLSVTAIVWTILLDAFLIVLHVTSTAYWLIFIIGAPAQLVILLSFKIIRLK